MGCNLNSAACMLKLNKPSGAKAACTEVLAVEGENIKALFRRASACVALQGFAEACVDLRKLLEVDPTNTEAQKLLAQAVQNGKAQSKQTSAMFSKMTKALDGNITEEQDKLREEERHQK